jgi:hypothetical protein
LEEFDELLTLVTNLLDRFIEFTLPSTCDKNIGTFLDEPFRRSKAYPTVSARDDRNFSIKSFCN